ncbi:hypothetical protein GALMADRAFT_233883 [Galerina marginata CBS 339.88]|uniref:Glutamine amidotransferase type-2 domain-containing protein n=1 Tax=Galerina marginata (strain CBS 339.88) TaxID=685588 RepID=A0A067TPQ6_GALM3|nr:hypothetical protein GALMADRAFT_233883 [Galerina marginata CBS 339.88]
MCGIFVSATFSDPDGNIGHESKDFSALRLKLQKMNADRGPDAQNFYSLLLDIATPTYPLALDAGECLSRLSVGFYASELRLRGEFPIVQPHIRGKNILCWNGEIFEGMEILAQDNDGSKIFDVLCSAESPEQIRDIFSTVEGPYAFVLYHENSDHLYYGRDPLGRRSLLVHKPTQEAPYFLLSSVSAGADPAYEFAELSTEHIYSLNFGSLGGSTDISSDFNLCIERISRTPSIPGISHEFAEPAQVNTSIPPDDLPRLESLDHIPGYLAQAVDGLIYHLDRSVLLRVRDIPRLSQNEQKARVGVLFSGGIDCAVITYLAHRHIPLDEPIDLLNVAFENPHKIRIQKEGNTGSISGRHKKSKAQIQDNKLEGENISYLVPDRVTGIMEVEELRRICPGRIWNFVEVNVPYEDCQAARPIIESLMFPGRTVMDLSLALALYFASRGKGHIRQNPESQPISYTSDARVLLNGLGSDELLGGYSRHRSVYKSGGWEAAIAELQQEIDRIPTRNLGRDDRVISAHGKETRHPFLSLSLVSFLASLPVHFKMDPRLELGVGDKMLLRLAARKLGLHEASCRKKRAMQFGSHSARMDGERRGDVDLE